MKISRTLNIILGFILGCFMLFNGLYEVFTDRYFSSRIPRPWVDMVDSFGINAFTMGPFLMVWGLAWLYFALMLISKRRRAFPLGICLCVATLWYFPFGTITSILVFCLLMGNKRPSGLLR